MSEPKKMDIREFREAGYLQEVNRQFFHPLGLALAVEHDTEDEEDETVEWRLYCIYDTDDPEGSVFDGFTAADVERGLRIGLLRSEMAKTRSRMSPDFDPITGVQRLEEKT